MKLKTVNATKYEGGDTQNPSLFIRHVDNDDEGYFVCSADNQAGTGISKEAIHVTVLAGLFIRSILAPCRKRRTIFLCNTFQSFI